MQSRPSILLYYHILKTRPALLANGLDTSRRTQTTEQGGIGTGNEYFFFGLTVNGNRTVVFFFICFGPSRAYPKNVVLSASLAELSGTNPPPVKAFVSGGLIGLREKGVKIPKRQISSSSSPARRTTVVLWVILTLWARIPATMARRICTGSISGANTPVNSRGKNLMNNAA